jgi:glycine/D-amino acid oxidase-like deaminating enzyme
VRLPTTSSPLWAIEPPSYPPLDGDREADVIVIGAGIAGLTAAVELVRAGKDVVVLEARSVGAGTSGRTTAKASALQGCRYRVLAELHGPEVARRYARSQIDGLAWMAERAAPVEAAQFRRRAAVTYATTADGRSTIEEEVAAAAAAGQPVERDDADLPFPITAAIRLADQAQLDPGPYLAALAAEIDRAPNGVVHEGTRATGVRGHRTLHVPTDRGMVRARHVVVATLLPIIDRGLFFARAEPKSSYLVALRVDGPIPQDMCLSTDEPTRSLRTAVHLGDEVLLVGGAGHHTGRGKPTTPRYQELVDWAADHFPVTDVLARWSAHDYVPVDHLPWVGSASIASPNAFVATGFEKWGMTMGTAAGIALAERIAGRDDVSGDWAGIFDPKRVAPRGLASAVRLNAQVAGRLASDWARPDAPPAPDGTGRRARAGVAPVGEPDADGPRVSVVCTHLGGVCEWNDGDRTWDCPLHGSRFEADGTVLAGPATRPLHRLRRTDPAED